MAKPGPNISDEEILSLLAQPEWVERGFRRLMEKYQERLYAHIRRLVGSHEDTDDVLQNCFIKIYRNIGSFRGQSKLYTWLYRIATNEALTFLKKRQRRAATPLDGEYMEAARQLRADPDFNSDTTERLLQKALDQLPEKQRIVFILRYYEELPYQEMSQVLETSVGALKASYHHAVKKIEHYFREVEI